MNVTVPERSKMDNKQSAMNNELGQKWPKLIFENTGRPRIWYPGLNKETKFFLSYLSGVLIA
jgi:hypothetical protein